MKECTKCKEKKHLSEFSKNPTSKSGYRSSCKACDAKQKKSAKKYRVEKEGEKVCLTCKELRSFKEFSINKTREDGLNYECKSCEKVRRVKRKEKDINYASFYYPVTWL